MTVWKVASTVASHFTAKLKQLVTKIQTAPSRFYPMHLIQNLKRIWWCMYQVRCGGAPGAVQVLRSGLPNRMECGKNLDDDVCNITIKFIESFFEPVLLIFLRSFIWGRRFAVQQTFGESVTNSFWIKLHRFSEEEPPKCDWIDDTFHGTQATTNGILIKRRFLVTWWRKKFLKAIAASN